MGELFPRTGTLSRRQHPRTTWLLNCLAVLSAGVLGECLISAFNAAASCNPDSKVFEYHHYLDWLPHSFDASRTWFAFWTYLGLGGLFWSLADWLGGLTEAEASQWLNRPVSSVPGGLPAVPARLKLLLWVLCVNGCCLGMESIVQRLAGSSRLLFVKQPRVNPNCLAQFGPFAYRSNAAQYFNLLWPVCLGFWLSLRQSVGYPSRHQNWLLLCAAIMAACPIIATTRGGAMVTAGMLILALFYCAFFVLQGTARNVGGSRPAAAVNLARQRPGTVEAKDPQRLAHATVLTGQMRAKSALAIGPGEVAQAGRSTGITANSGLYVTFFFMLTLSLGLALGWKALAPRLLELQTGNTSYDSRIDLYRLAEPMAKDYPWFGTGPGTFASVFNLYRVSSDADWPAELHNDWLEIRITFGWLGLGALLLALGTVVLRSLVPGGICGSSPHLVVFGWLALGGCMIHAGFDFPLQLYSTLLLFLVICAVLTNLSFFSTWLRRPE